MESLSPTALRQAGWLLFAGGAFAIVGAFCPPYRQWSAPQEEGFRAIAGNPVGWWCIHVGFFLGTVFSALGLATLASVLYRRTGGEWALLAAVAFGLAGTAWIANLAYRVSIWNWAAETYVATGVTPETFFPLQRWAGMLFVIFAILGYASVALLGVGLFRADLGPAWLRWAILVCGVSAGYVVGYNVPFIMYLPFAALGIVLLRGGAG
jgi:hypothetical protein